MSESRTEPANPLTAPSKIKGSCDREEDVVVEPPGGESLNIQPKSTNPFDYLLQRRDGDGSGGRGKRMLSGTETGRGLMMNDSSSNGSVLHFTCCCSAMQS